MRYSKHNTDSDIFENAYYQAREHQVSIYWKAKYLDKYARFYTEDKYREVLYDDTVSYEELKRDYITRLRWLRNSDRNNGLALFYNPYDSLWAIVPVFGYIYRDDLPSRAFCEIFDVPRTA